MRTQNLWPSLSAQPFPYLHGLAVVERVRFMLLGASLRDCLDEWCASGGQLSARSIVLLDDCIHTITRHFRLLNGEGQWYGWRHSGDWSGGSCAASMGSRHMRG
jgi:hypothetical protein